MKALNTNNGFLKLLSLATVLFLHVCISSAQPVIPQRAITVTPTQSLNFGRFCVTGSGGTVTIPWQGSVTSTGGIVLISAPTPYPAIFEIKLCEGRQVTITFSATTLLSGSNGGSLILDIGPTEKGVNGVIFATNSDCNFITPLRVGGTLHVPGTAIPGIYTGSFDMTFNQQ